MYVKLFKRLFPALPQCCWPPVIAYYSPVSCCLSLRRGSYSNRWIFSIPLSRIPTIHTCGDIFSKLRIFMDTPEVGISGTFRFCLKKINNDCEGALFWKWEWARSASFLIGHFSLVWLIETGRSGSLVTKQSNSLLDLEICKYGWWNVVVMVCSTFWSFSIDFHHFLVFLYIK